MLLNLLTHPVNYNTSKLLNSVIRKRTCINMNDTYYISEEEKCRDDISSCGEDCEECWELKNTNDNELVNNDDELVNNDDELVNNDDELVNKDKVKNKEDEECYNCNNENCSYFCIDNECKIKCINCD